VDPFHERLARVALEHIGRFGFALAGGHAVQAHGMVERPSEDVDLFTTAISEEQFATASAAALDECAFGRFNRLHAYPVDTGM
jgi:hypothetical protein